MREIPITRDRIAIVDDEDYERIASHSWALNPQGTGYAVRKGSKRRGEPRTVQMHREVLGVEQGTIIDHINGNGLDNRKANLRIADTQRNAFNRWKPNIPCTSQYKGVIARKKGPSWHARIKYRNKCIELGAFREEAYAAAAYNFAARVLFGTFRRENQNVGELTRADKELVLGRIQRVASQRGWDVTIPAPEET